jgi:hypothetical protein
MVWFRVVAIVFLVSHSLKCLGIFVLCSGLAGTEEPSAVSQVGCSALGLTYFQRGSPTAERGFWSLEECLSFFLFHGFLCSPDDDGCSFVSQVVAVPATPSPTTKVPDPFLMEALYALAWQRKLDRQRSMAFALRSSLLPMLKRVHLSDALRHWRGVVRQAKIQVVVSPTNSTGSAKSLPNIVPYRDPTQNIDFNQPGAVMYSPIVWTSGVPTDMSSPDSRSSSGSNIESPFAQSPRTSYRTTSSSTISPGVPQAFCFQSPKPMISRQSTCDFGEEIGLRVDKRRSDSDTFYTIHTLKHSGSQLFGSRHGVNAELGMATTPRPTPPMPSNYSNPAQALSRFPVC